METDAASDQARDAQSVSAVQAGDVERYRELVERHERRVFAVAWSRLGDAALAEEAAQEAFISGYRKLWLLGDGAKFAGWITAIARRAAINLGLRHRRELNKRERWALEPAESPETAAGETPGACTPEMLRQTLTGLPAAHRECLVLFYLEGKSGAEAAAALGISEAAFRVRLHRARGFLRDQLEDKLEGSLQKLRPAKTLVPAVMAAVLASTSAKAATAGGVGAAILGTLAKFAPFKWLFLFPPLVLSLFMVLPGLLLYRWRVRDEQKNYRDPDGFRARLYQEAGPVRLVFFGLGLVLVLYFTLQAGRLLGIKTFFLVMGLFTLIGFVLTLRQLEINRSRSQICTVFNFLIQTIFLLGIGLGRLPVMAMIAVSGASSFLSMFAARSLPLRMDYNLFLRDQQGLLPPFVLETPKETAARFDRATLRTFARFLSERQLVNKFRWSGQGLRLYLSAVKSPLRRFWHGIFPSPLRHSLIVLGWDGSVSAHCGKNDAAGLTAPPSISVHDLAAMEARVALAVTLAWRNFRAGDAALAERAIGQIADAEIFLVPTARTAVNRWMLIVAGGLVALGLMVLGVTRLFSARLSGLNPVSLTEVEVRAFFGRHHHESGTQ